MTTADAVRRLALRLPRTYERDVRGSARLKVGPLVYAALSDDEQSLGFAFPKLEREGLIASAPDVFFLPRPSDLRYQWVCAHLPRLGEPEMRELVTDAWRMCVPAMLHELPDLPAPTAELWARLDEGSYAEARALLHPYLHWRDRDVALRGRSTVLEHLREHPRPRPPREVEIRDGQVYRWCR